MPADNDALFAAIAKADAPVLRFVLQSMCNASPVCRSQASSRLLLSTNKRKADDDGVNIADKKARTDRLKPRFEKCTTCGKVFDVTQNFKTSCQTHPEPVSVDVDHFQDDDDINYNNNNPWMDPDWENDWRFEEFPEGFYYECCDRRANEKPCLVQMHKAAGESLVEVSSDEGSTQDDDAGEDEEENEDEGEDEDEA